MRHRVLEHPRDRVLARRAHDDVVHVEALGGTTDLLGALARRPVLLVRHAGVGEERDRRRHRRVGAVAQPAFAVGAADEARGMARQARLHVEEMDAQLVMAPVFGDRVADGAKRVRRGVDRDEDVQHGKFS